MREIRGSYVISIENIRIVCFRKLKLISLGSLEAVCRTKKSKIKFSIIWISLGNLAGI